ncbi:SDR family NAD(P)-dependent oxidoreductase [Burkholderia ambifaria]|uniref:SDR family NAD(P)-dependent oxidoreductase n=1 Tax=Burkholderia TaxID=32008 RepID=UPI0018F5662D|nr:SDR family NAD(P)-dependent oxidoreductase [Burkholderia ambifaria]QQJ98185.1 SDR family NAD(P)-dependent oxidoreductase [Burkholderia ambifaria]
MASVFISGVSDGIGHALAAHYLDRGWTVYGIARRRPDALLASGNMVFKQCDLLTLDEATDLFNGVFAPIAQDGVSVVYLNAGVSGTAPRRARECSSNELQRTLTVNTVANKLLLDAFLALPTRPDVVVASASIAGVRFRAGMLPYSLSKAALLALCGVYAEEYPDVFFAVLGMCNVDTALSREIVFSPRIAEFPEHARLKERFRTPGYAVAPAQRAVDVFDLIHPKPDQRLTSGRFIEIRALLAPAGAE